LSSIAGVIVGIVFSPHRRRIHPDRVPQSTSTSARIRDQGGMH